MEHLLLEMGVQMPVFFNKRNIDDSHAYGEEDNQYISAPFFKPSGAGRFKTTESYCMGGQGNRIKGEPGD